MAREVEGTVTDHVPYENGELVSFCLECGRTIEDGQAYCESCYDMLCEEGFFDYDESGEPF